MSAKIEGKLLILHRKTEFDDEIDTYNHNNYPASCFGSIVVRC